MLQSNIRAKFLWAQLPLARDRGQPRSPKLPLSSTSNLGRTTGLFLLNIKVEYINSESKRKRLTIHTLGRKIGPRPFCRQPGDGGIQPSEREAEDDGWAGGRIERWAERETYRSATTTGDHRTFAADKDASNGTRLTIGFYGELAKKMQESNPSIERLRVSA